MKKICVINLGDRGDVIQSSAAIVQLKSVYPNAEITFVSTDSSRMAVINSPLVTNSICLRTSGETSPESYAYPKLLTKLASKRYDLVVDLGYERKSRFMSFLSLPGRRTPIIRNFSKLSNLERHEALLKGLGIDSPLPNCECWTGPDSKMFADDFLERAGIGDNDLLIGLNPGDDWESKRWPQSFYSETGDYLSRVHGAKTIIFGEQSQRDIAVNIYKQMDKKPMLAAGRTNFEQTCALIGRCNLLITGDSIYMQAARGYKVPMIVIFGSTSPDKALHPLTESIKILRDTKCSPPCGRSICKLKTRDCLWAITPAMVIERAEELLNLSIDNLGA